MHVSPKEIFTYYDIYKTLTALVAAGASASEAASIVSNYLTPKKRKNEAPQEPSPHTPLRVPTAQDLLSPTSRTRTETEEDEDTMVTSSQHNDMDAERHTIFLNPPKRLYKSLGKWKYNWTVIGDTSLVAKVGYQYAVDMLAYMPTQWYTGSADVNRYRAYGIEHNIFDLNPYQTNTGGNVVGSIVAPVPDYVHIHDVESTYVITNFSNMSAWVEVKWYQALTDTTTDHSPTQWWVLCNSSKALGQSAEVPASLTTTTTATAGVLIVATQATSLGNFGCYTHYGMNPSAEKEFRRMYKVVKKTHFVMQGGDTRKISLKVAVNKTVSKAFYKDQQSSQSSLGFNRGTIFATIIVRPSLVHVTDTSTSEPTFGNPLIGWVISNKVNLSSLGGSRLEYNRGFMDNVVGNSHTSSQLILDTDLIGNPQTA